METCEVSYGCLKTRRLCQLDSRASVDGDEGGKVIAVIVAVVLRAEQEERSCTCAIVQLAISGRIRNAASTRAAIVGLAAWLKIYIGDNAKVRREWPSGGVVKTGRQVECVSTHQ